MVDRPSSIVRRSWVMVALALMLASPIDAQTKRPAPTRKPVPAARKLTVAPAEMTCPSPLGTGVKTKREYCDVLTGRDPKEGIIIKLPPHRGAGDAAIQSPQPPHLLGRRGEDEARIRVLHRRHRRADARQHAADARGSGHRVPQGRRPDRTYHRRGRPRRCQSRRACWLRGDLTCQLAADLNEVTILGEKLTVVRADGQPANYAAPGPPDRHHQRRDRGIHTGASTALMNWWTGRSVDCRNVAGLRDCRLKINAATCAGLDESSFVTLTTL